MFTDGINVTDIRGQRWGKWGRSRSPARVTKRCKARGLSFQSDVGRRFAEQNIPDIDIDWEWMEWVEENLTHFGRRGRRIGETLTSTTDELPGAPDLSMSASSATKALLLWAETNFKKTLHVISLSENTKDYEMVWVHCDWCIVRLIFDCQSRNWYLGEYDCSSEDRCIISWHIKSVNRFLSRRKAG